ncbi:hypothetical protein GCM10007320_66370 [Pseudorhodoferax aquiterrae]|uniref:Transposase n=2 Tax=Pseudorhodoferax aquiterrae TaxID=747304 RepID=A0ABQ3GG16_9BURK|nr:hypothetical protein GCM10007320_66370 [Pseudorhodoferax aquiterrae]
MANDINANLVRRWVKEAEVGAEIEPGTAASEAKKLAPATTPTLKVLASADSDSGPACRGRHPHRTAARRGERQGDVAGKCSKRMSDLDARAASMIRIDALWLSAKPIDMRAGAERLPTHVVKFSESPMPVTATSSRMRAARASSCSFMTDKKRA